MALKNLFLNFQKINAEERIVEGIATTETFDGEPGVWKGKAFDGDIVETSAIEAALPDYLAWGNVREMHQPSAVGTVVKAEIVKGQLHIAVKVVDDSAWQKVKEGVYKGFSIGGRTLAAVFDKAAGQIVRRITKLLLVEISLVDRPANPDARILEWKGVAMDGDDLEKTVEAILAKAADPQKAVAGLQQLRNQCELDGDLEGAALYTQAIALVMQASGNAEVAAPEAAEGEAVAEGEGGEGDKEVEMGKKATSLKKAGRTFNGRNAQALHGVAKGILELLAGTGDAVAQKALLAYAATTKGAGIETKLEASTGLTAEEVAGAVKKAFEPTFTKVADVLKVVDGRLDHLEKQPAGGGPQLRNPGATEKTVLTNGNNEDDLKKREAAKARERRIADLRQLANTEPNPALRQQYQQQLTAALAAQ